MQHFRLLSFNFDLHYLSELYLGTYLLESNMNKNKIKIELGSHICLHTIHNLIVFTYRHMYVNSSISVVSTQTCHPSYQVGTKK